MSGQFPLAMGAMKHLRVLDFSSMSLSGPLPAGLGGCSILESLYVNDNFLDGTVPGSFVELSVLRYLALGGNSQLHGSLPMNLTSLPALDYLDTSNTLLSGVNPLLQGISHILEYLDCTSSYFTGTLPSNWSTFHDLTHVLLDSNFLTGTLPSTYVRNAVSDDDTYNFGSIISLIEFSVSDNHLSGPIPTTIGTHTNLTLLSLSANDLTGSLPSELAHIISLVTLNVSNNRLSGSLSSLFVDGVSTPLVMLSYLSLDENAFSGTLPSSLFLAPSLSAVVVSSNCFSGALPSTICHASLLTTLVMNGINSGKGCRVQFPRLLGMIFKGILSTQKVSSSLSSCLFHMPSLETLQLAGNGLTGSLPSGDNISMLVKNVELGYNSLVGTIPASIQQRGNFVSLGLQHNRLTGTLLSDFNVQRNESSSSTTTIRLHVNRLSGRLPESFHSLAQINVLYGNLFSCASSHELPINDPTTDTYSCGSNNFNLALYIWLGAVGLCTASFGAVLILVFLISTVTTVPVTSHMLPQGPRSIENNLVSKPQESVSTFSSQLLHIYFSTLQWYDFRYPSGKEMFTNTFQFLTLLKRAGSGMMLLAGMYLLVVMVAYILMKSFGEGVSHGGSNSFSVSTIYHQYGWIVTSAYMHGCAPAVGIAVCLFISLFLTAARIRSRKRKVRRLLTLFNHRARAALTSRSARQVENSTANNSERGSSSEYGLPKSAFDASPTPSFDYCLFLYQYIGIPIFFQVANASFAIFVNAEYVKALAFGNISPNEQFGLELLLSMFKIGWSSSFVPWAMTYFRHLSSGQCLCHQVFMLCVVLILAPLLASMVGSDSCFYDVFVTDSPITSTFEGSTLSFGCFAQITDIFVDGREVTYLVSSCESGDNILTMETASSPPFVYSYQCGSVILSNYIPVFLYSYVVAALVAPFFRVFIVHCPLSVLNKYLPPVLYNAFIRGTLFECDDMINQNAELSHVTTSMTLLARVAGTAVDPPPPDAASAVISPVSVAPTTLPSATPASAASGSGGRPLLEVRPLFDAPNVVAKRLLDIAVMLTFGLACPILGLAVAFSVVVNAGVWRIMIGKYLSYHAGQQSQRQNSYFHFIRLEGSARGVLTGAKTAMWVVTMISCAFWSLLLYDMVGDVYGQRSGILVMCMVLFILPIILVISLRCFDRVETSKYLKYLLQPSWLTTQDNFGNEGTTTLATGLSGLTGADRLNSEFGGL
jgi:hypothetical protein